MVTSFFVMSVFVAVVFWFSWTRRGAVLDLGLILTADVPVESVETLASVNRARKQPDPC